MPTLQSLDIEILDEDVDIHLPPQLTELTIRKSPTTAYLSSDNIRRFIHRLAEQLPSTLSTVNVGFKLSDPMPDPTSPITHLANALASLPNLHTFITLLPSVWSDVLLVVSGNPSLRRITLGQGIIPTGLFMNTAVKHSKLMELIRAGTPIIRHRAQTLPQGGFPPFSSSPATSRTPISISTTTLAPYNGKKQALVSSPQSAHPHPHPHNTRVLQRRWSLARP
ncbi:hypothetical protein L218DRAFT_993798 [Marasmius fiardii PR-910]|nr:hypothetical protein L218DRAFT_993798 [Marasmius fiardii PR-910]